MIVLFLFKYTYDKITHNLYYYYTKDNMALFK